MVNSGQLCEWSSLYNYTVSRCQHDLDTSRGRLLCGFLQAISIVQVNNELHSLDLQGLCKNCLTNTKACVTHSSLHFILLGPCKGRVLNFQIIMNYFKISHQLRLCFSLNYKMQSLVSTFIFLLIQVKFCKSYRFQFSHFEFHVGLREVFFLNASNLFAQTFQLFFSDSAAMKWTLRDLCCMTSVIILLIRLQRWLYIN